MSFWKSVREKKDSKGPFQEDGLLFASGSIVGILSPDCINEKLQGHEQILIVVPHFHHVITPTTGPRIAQGRSTPRTPRTASAAGSRFKAPVPLTAVEESDCPEPPSSPGPTWASLSQKPGSSTPIKDERQSTPLPETSTGGGFEIFDIDGSDGHSAHESRESIRAGKKRKGPTQDVSEIEKAARPGPSTPSIGSRWQCLVLRF